MFTNHNKVLKPAEKKAMLEILAKVSEIDIDYLKRVKGKPTITVADALLSMHEWAEKNK